MTEGAKHDVAAQQALDRSAAAHHDLAARPGVTFEADEGIVMARQHRQAQALIDLGPVGPHQDHGTAPDPRPAATSPASKFPDTLESRHYRHREPCAASIVSTGGAMSAPAPSGITLHREPQIALHDLDPVYTLFRDEP